MIKGLGTMIGLERWEKTSPEFRKLADDLEGAVSKSETGDQQDDMERLLSFFLSEIFLKEHKRSGDKIRRPAFSIVGDHPLWADHCYDLKKGGIEFWVSEPYNIGTEDLEQILKTCKNQQAEVTIDGASVHFPGRTIRIRIHKTGEKG